MISNKDAPNSQLSNLTNQNVKKFRHRSAFDEEIIKSLNI